MACSKVPKNILSEKEMQQVHTDMLIADAIIGTDYNVYPTDSAKIEIYESVFRKYQISRALYDSSLVWYGRNLDIYMKIYERIIADLTRRNLDLGDIQADLTPTSRNDSVNIWPRRNYMVFHPQSVFNGVTFDLKPETNYPSGSSFVLGVRVWGLPEGMNHYPEIRMVAEQRDTTLRAESRITKDGYYETVLKTMPTRQVRRVYGYIWMNSRDSIDYKIYVDSLTLIRYNYGTTFEIKGDGAVEQTPESPSDSLQVISDEAPVKVVLEN